MVNKKKIIKHTKKKTKNQNQKPQSEEKEQTSKPDMNVRIMNPVIKMLRALMDKKENMQEWAM